jgi:hypothetical protein
MKQRNGWGRTRNILLWVAGIILIANSFVIRGYGDIIRSSHLFIASPALFYPLAFLNLIAGLVIILTLLWGLLSGRRRDQTK